MLTIPAKTVYVDPAVRARPACAARLERMWPHVACDDVRTMTPGDYRAVFDLGQRRHGKDDLGDDAVLVFTTFDEGRLDWFYHYRDAGRVGENQGGACQSALELNVVDGCMFRCAYCGFGRRVVFYLDVERFMAGLDAQFARYPRQRLWKYSNMTDLPPFEPELDAVRPMVEQFAREADRYLMLFTKSDNVDFLLGLDHGGRTIVSWSLSGRTVSREVDKRTAPMEGRLEAMGRCQAAGYRVRARLSPIVPVRGWREEYRELLERLLATVRPDVVTVELLGWMDFRDLTQIVPRELIDDAAWAGAEAAADRLAGRREGPFDEATHEAVYRFCIETVRELSPGTPVAVCHGTPAVWAALGEAMGMTAEAYICNCGPQSAPGGATYDWWHAASGGG